MSELTQKLPVYPDNKTHFIKEFFEPIEREERVGYLSKEKVFELAAEKWQETMRHPIDIKYRQFKRAQKRVG